MKNTRRILITLMAAAAVAFAIPGGAMATHGNCDPSPAAFNIQQQTKGNGEVLIWVAYGWDGVSVYPDCHGPLVGARTQNTSLTTTWYAHLTGRRGQPRVVAILPNTTTTYSAAQLSSVGLDTIDDISGLTLTTSP